MSTQVPNFKVALIGDSGVGKSSIMCKYADGTYSPTHSTTIGIDVKVRYIENNGEKIKMTIWDTAGQEKYDCITANYLKQSQVGVLVFALDDYQSLLNVGRWLKKMTDEHSTDDNVNYMLVGNKLDVKNARPGQIPLGEIEDLLKKLEIFTNKKITYLEVSAKNNVNIKELFDHIAKQYVSDIKNKVKMEQLSISSTSSPPIYKRCCVIL